ncbi:MAG: fumarylacetoacetate hydrolase family protein [Spirochaetia bacterium]|nr:fumarylacetoacetate hydrolase family protein [Spirochaetia bacterium]
MKSISALALIVIPIVAALALLFYLFRPLSKRPVPAQFVCLREIDGQFTTFTEEPEHIYGIGLSYAKHIEETAHEFNDAKPAVFRKATHTLHRGNGVTLFPAPNLIAQAEKFESGVGKILAERFPNMGPLLDYEVELGFVLLRDINPGDLEKPDFVPELGFFIANDVSSRALAVLGEGQKNRYEYWGMSKSFPGFLPVSVQIWIPANQKADAIPCVRIETRVNGQLRQSENTADMIFTPITMLRAIQSNYPADKLKRGDRIVMGTPGGIALETPRWKARFAGLLSLDRFTKLKFILRANQDRFLKPGDQVSVSGEWLGSVTTEIR